MVSTSVTFEQSVLEWGVLYSSALEWGGTGRGGGPPSVAKRLWDDSQQKLYTPQGIKAKMTHGVGEMGKDLASIVLVNLTYL